MQNKWAVLVYFLAGATGPFLEIRAAFTSPFCTHDSRTGDYRLNIQQNGSYGGMVGMKFLSALRRMQFCLRN